MDNSKERIIELLAPAGSWEALEAAVNAGADAVYMGGKAFGARQYASNFDREEMAKAALISSRLSSRATTVRSMPASTEKSTPALLVTVI